MLKEGCAVITVSALLVEELVNAGAYHIEVHHYQDRSRTQTYENAVFTATVTALPKLFDDPALSEMQSPQFRVVSSMAS